MKIFMKHLEIFGHLAHDAFTAQEAAEYLEVSMPTFRRYVRDNKLHANKTLGRNQLFAVHDLRVLKRALKI